MAAEEISLRSELAALRSGVAALERGQGHLVAEFDRARRELREDVAEVQQDVRDLRAQLAAFQNGQYVFSGAIIAGLLGVIATLIATG